MRLAMNLPKLVSNLRELIAPQNSKGSSEQPEMISLREKTCRAFSFESIAAATLNFSPANKLGEGGYGEVFKGRLEDGRMVAVKRLGVGSKQGEKEFKVEAKLLSQLQHRNIVNLYGYCLHQEEKMLVYEFVRNQSLDKFLFSEKGSFMACNFSTVSLALSLPQNFSYCSSVQEIRTVVLLPSLQ